MKPLKSRSTLAIAAAVAATAVGGGAGLAGAQGGSGSPSGFMDSLARHLGISREKLDDSTKAAAIDQVDAARADGGITKAQADDLKARIESGEAPPFFGPGPFGPPHGGPHGLGDKLSAAADYLGLGSEQLQERLRAGRSLADVARAEGKSVDGLEQAIIAAAREDLDDAVADGRLSREEADQLLERLESHVDKLVEGTFERHRLWRGHPGRAFPGSAL